MDYNYTVAVDQGGATSSKREKSAGFTTQQPVFLGPVYGWLVVASGRRMGSDFPILQSPCQIGSGLAIDVGPEAGDVVLALHYEPEAARFALYRQSGDVWLNDLPMGESSYLQAHDRIAFGGVILVFIPYC